VVVCFIALRCTTPPMVFRNENPYIDALISEREARKER
jgi:hypothetical protein